MAGCALSSADRPARPHVGLDRGPSALLVCKTMYRSNVGMSTSLRGRGSAFAVPQINPVRVLPRALSSADRPARPHVGLDRGPSALLACKTMYRSNVGYRRLHAAGDQLSPFLRLTRYGFSPQVCAENRRAVPIPRCLVRGAEVCAENRRAVPIPLGTSGWLVAPSRRPTAQRGPTSALIAGPPRCWHVRRCTEVTWGCRRLHAAGDQLSPFLRLTSYGFSRRRRHLLSEWSTRYSLPL